MYYLLSFEVLADTTLSVISASKINEMTFL